MELLFIDACVRQAHSRTRKLARSFLDRYREAHPDTHITTLDLTELDLSPQTPRLLRQRDQLWAEGRLDNPLFDLAHQFAKADRLVIAAPFWDLSFPAILKIYLERISCNKITFGYGPQGELLGLCRAEKLLLITTRGGDFSQPDTASMEMGARYLEALCRMYGIPTFQLLCAEGLDDVRNDASALLAEAIKRAGPMAQGF